MTEDGRKEWRLALRALDLLQRAPQAFGGLHLRARSGPAREIFLRHVGKRFRRVHRISADFDPDSLFGGLDLLASLAAGTRVTQDGVMNRIDCLCISGAERLDPARAAQLAQHLDGHATPIIILLDEGLEDDPMPSSILRERLAFAVGLEHVSCRHITEPIDQEQQHYLPLSSIPCPRDLVQSACQIALGLGVDALRVPYFLAQASRAIAALENLSYPQEPHMREAVELVLTGRAVSIPAEEEEAPQTPERTTPNDSAESAIEDREIRDPTSQFPTEQLIAAARAVLDPAILERLKLRDHASAKNSIGQSGVARRGNRRGRPLPARPGKPGTHARLDVVTSLRAAAPWQNHRRALLPQRKSVIVFARDLHIKRHQEQSDRVIIFAVDASGSAAFARLAEVKGAVELMLGHSYARRDHVALLAFRDRQADVLLPPTRSLVQTKRRLAALPGGGATPLAKGMQTAHILASQAAKRGLSPVIALLTDGRGNIDLSGHVDRPMAQHHALEAAQQWRSAGHSSLIIDSAMRPQPQLRALSAACGGTYLPLPRARAQQMAAALGEHLG